MAKRERKLTLPVKTHGGKGYLATRIVARFPKHLHYVEPYFGGGAVLLARDPGDESLWVGKAGGTKGVSEVANDLNGALMNFWRVLREPHLFEDLRRQLEATPLARQAYALSSAYLADNRRKPGAPPFDCSKMPRGFAVSWAYHFFVVARQSHAGTMKGFTSLTRNRTRRGVNGNASEWLGAIDGLAAVHARLRPVVVECVDALTLIAREDTRNTLYYLDPPYLHETRTSKKAYGDYEVDAEHHRRLLALLAGIKGKFILSGYRSKMYDDAAEKHGWRREEFDIANHAAGGAAKRRMTECIWYNF